MKTFLLLITLATTSCLAEGKYYKWIDKQGNIHYSENKPENNPSSEINIITSKPTSEMSTSEPKGKSDRKKETSYKLEKFAEQDQYRRKKEKARKRRCRDAKKSMNKLKASFVPYSIDPRSGGRIYPSSRTASKIKARQQERIRKKQILVSTACKRK